MDGNNLGAMDRSMFMPHGHCFLWEPGLLVLHVGSDLLIAVAYFTIPLALYQLHKNRPDIAFRNVFLLFAVFILACGATHLFDAWNMWNSDYWQSGGVKLATAIASLTTATVLWRMLPAALKWPSPAQLASANARLREEVVQREQVNAALKEGEALFRGAFECAPIGMALVNPEGSFIRVNPALSEMLGYSEDELLGIHISEVTYEADLESDLKAAEGLLSGDDSHYRMEKRYVHKSGHIIWTMLAATLVRSEDGRPDYFVAHIVDISERKAFEQGLNQARQELEDKVHERTRELAVANQKLQESNQLLNQLAQSDPLSGLANRRSLLEFMAYQLEEARRYRVDWCLIMMDIDYFKQINDRYGHLAGDKVIRAIGEILSSNVRETDLASRYGGDEFVLVFPHARLPQVRVIAEKIYKGVKERIIRCDNGDAFRITCSIGMAEWRPEIISVEQMLELADKALYQAKARGRNAIASPLDE